jgi:hypothetical protein
MSRNTGFGARKAEGGHPQEIGAPIDLGITMSIFGKHTRFIPDKQDHGVPRSAGTLLPTGVDECTTEH